MADLSYGYGNRKILAELLGMHVVRYALVNDISSLYNEEDALDETERRILYDTAGRISALMDGGTRITNILLYFPEEGVNDGTNNSWTSLSQNLWQNQLDYLTADLNTIELAEIKDGCIKLLDNKFRYLVLPYCNINRKLLGLLARLEKENIAVLSVMDSSFSDGLFLDEVRKLMVYKNVRVYRNERELFMNLTAMGASDVFFKRETEVVYMKKINGNGENYLFVNTKNESAKSEIEIVTEKTNVTLYNPVTDETLPLESSSGKGKISFELGFSPYGFHIVRAE